LNPLPFSLTQHFFLSSSLFFPVHLFTVLAQPNDLARGFQLCMEGVPCWEETSKICRVCMLLPPCSDYDFPSIEGVISLLNVFMDGVTAQKGHTLGTIQDRNKNQNFKYFPTSGWLTDQIFYLHFSCTLMQFLHISIFSVQLAYVHGFLFILLHT
jgi:hypothetical protein